MAQARSASVRRSVPLFVLPSLYALLVAFAIVQSARVAGGTYYRIFGVNPIAAFVGMASGDGFFYAFLLIFGILWWFYIGYVGWKSWRGSLSRPSSALGALISLISVAFAVGLTQDTFRHDDTALSAGAVIQYAGVGVLCLGALAATLSSTIAVLRRNKKSAEGRANGS
jgi:hypothetical protein